MDKVVKCELCRFVFDYPRNGDLYFIRGEEHAICNGCADRVAEMRRFTAEFEKGHEVLSNLRRLFR